MPADSFVSTLPIGHLPSVILSRFGIPGGQQVLTPDAWQFFFNELKAELLAHRLIRGSVNKGFGRFYANQLGSWQK